MTDDGNTRWGDTKAARVARSTPLVIPALLAGVISLLGTIAIVLSARRMPGLHLPDWAILGIAWLGLIILLVGVLKYDWLVLATFCLMGFVRFEPAPFDLLLVVLFVIGLLTGKLSSPDFRSRPLIFLGLWGLILANFLSVVANFGVAADLRFLGITLYVLLLFVFIRMYAVEPEKMRLVLIGCTVAAILNALPVVLGFFGLSIPISVVAWSTRGVGFFKDANVFGPFLIVAAFWLVDRIMCRPRGLAHSVFFLVLALLLAIGAVLSLSRGAWLNMLIAGCLFLMFLFRSSPKRGMLFILFALVLVLISLLIFQFLGLIEVVIAHSQLQGYDILRFSIQREGLISAFRWPLGVGPAQWENAHSLYVKTFAEQGILGLAALGILIGALIFPLARMALGNRGSAEVITAGVLLAIIAGQLVNSLVIDSMHWRHLWVVLGLAWAYLELYRSRTGEVAPARIPRSQAAQTQVSP